MLEIIILVLLIILLTPIVIAVGLVKNFIRTSRGQKSLPIAIAFLDAIMDFFRYLKERLFGKSKKQSKRKKKIKDQKPDNFEDAEFTEI